MHTLDTACRSTRTRWMVVDDNADILAMMREMLNLATDADVDYFNSSAEALLAFQAEPSAYNFVITDYHMPGMDGMDLCLRMLAMRPQLKVLLSTSDVGVSEQEALAHGFCALLRKPFAFASLRDLLAMHADSNIPAVTDSRDSAFATDWQTESPRRDETFLAKLIPVFQGYASPKPVAPWQHWIASF